MVPFVIGTVFFVTLLYYAKSDQVKTCSSVEVMLSDRARVISKVLHSAVKSEMKCGSIVSESFDRFLQGVFEFTDMKAFYLIYDNEIKLGYPIGSMLKFEAPGKSGQDKAGSEYYYWTSVNDPAFSIEEVKSGSGVKLVLEFPYEGCKNVHQAAAEKFWLTVVVGVLSVFVFLFFSCSAIRNFRLKRRVEVLQVHKDQLVELNLASSGLAHETKNPLGIIRGLAQRILQCDGVVGSVESMAQEIVEQADVTADRLGDFMNYARFSEADFSPVPVLEALQSVLTVISQDCSELGVSFVYPVDEVVIEADDRMLVQIVTNLLFNSLNAVEEGDSISLAVEHSGRSVTLIVSDTGCGMDESFMAEVFKPYVTGSGNGHGIGLSVVKRCVDSLDWNIELESILGKSTTFSIKNIKVG